MKPALTTPSATVASLGPFERFAFAPFTFPAYQHLVVAPGGETRKILVGAHVGGAPAGLAVAEKVGQGKARLRSIWVEPELRRRGVGARMLAEVERLAAARGLVKIEAVYRSTLAGREAFESFLASAEWGAPRLRMLVLETNYGLISQAPFMQRPPTLGPGFSLEPWEAVTPGELSMLSKVQRFSPEVWPGNYGADFHRETSLAIRRNGELVGWIVNHPKSPGLLRFTTGYIRDDMQARGRLAAAIAASVHRMPGTGYDRGVWTMPVEFPKMITFARKRLVPFSTHYSETFGMSKVLGGAGANGCVL